jgi:hypothetical protein
MLHAACCCAGTPSETPCCATWAGCPAEVTVSASDFTWEEEYVVLSKAAGCANLAVGTPIRTAALSFSLTGLKFDKVSYLTPGGQTCWRYDLRSAASQPDTALIQFASSGEECGDCCFVDTAFVQLFDTCAATVTDGKINDDVVICSAYGGSMFVESVDDTTCRGRMWVRVPFCAVGAGERGIEGCSFSSVLPFDLACVLYVEATSNTWLTTDTPPCPADLTWTTVGWSYFGDFGCGGGCGDPGGCGPDVFAVGAIPCSPCPPSTGGPFEPGCYESDGLCGYEHSRCQEYADGAVLVT